MEALFAVVIGVLVAAGVMLLLSRTIVRVVLGLAFLAYGANLTILTSAGLRPFAPPLLTVPGPHVDPLPQALILTAIVIGFATTSLLLTIAVRAYQVSGHDDVSSFGDNLSRRAQAPDAERADPTHPSSPEEPEAGELETPEDDWRRA